jgi:four helix bundle protein
MKGRIFDLQDRLIDFAVRIIRLSEAIPESKAGKHICSQLLRSGTSPAPNYGEAQSAESKADFIHKLNIVQERKDCQEKQRAKVNSYLDIGYSIENKRRRNSDGQNEKVGAQGKEEAGSGKA